MNNTGKVIEKPAKEAFIIILKLVLIDSIVRLAAGGVVYFILIRLTSLDARQLSAIIIAMTIGSKIHIKLRVKE